MNVIQISLIGVFGALLAVQFQSLQKEYATYISVALSVFLLVCVAGKLRVVVEMINEMKSYLSFESTYFSTLLKILGITYVAEFAASICKDTGHQSLAMQIGVFGKLTILVLSLPILYALLKTIASFLS